MQNLHLFEQKLFQCHVHHYQYLAVLVELGVMGFVFWFIVIEITETTMTGECDCVKECHFYNVISHLVCWLVIFYSICTSHIVTDNETFLKILHTLPKGPKLNITEQYGIYRSAINNHKPTY